MDKPCNDGEGEGIKGEGNKKPPEGGFCKFDYSKNLLSGLCA